MPTHPVSVYVQRPVRGQPPQRGVYKADSTLSVRDLDLLRLDVIQAEKRKPIRTLIFINCERIRNAR